MALKIIEHKQEEVKVEYPCLMESTDPNFPDSTRVVLAIDENSGIDIINSHNPLTQGTLHYDFVEFSDEDYWKPYNDSVTFSNK